MASAWKAERIRSASTTIFAEMSALALTTQSINLGQGFRYDGRPHARGGSSGHAHGINHTRPAAGFCHCGKPSRAQQPDLRSELRRRLGGPGHHRCHRALAASIWRSSTRATRYRPEPFYDSYSASIELAGGQRVGVGLFGPDSVDHTSSRRVHSQDQGAVDNSPHIPPGRTGSR